MMEYYRSLLSASDEMIYEKIYRSWQNRAAQVTFAPCNERDICHLVEYVALDHPELFYIQYNRFDQISAPLWTKLCFSMQYTDREIGLILQYIEEMKNYVHCFLPKQADEERKAWMIFDYLSRQVEYRENGSKSFSVVGCLPEYGHAAVCEGIAKTFKLLCDANDIPCIVATGFVGDGGEQGRHAWNIVKISGQYRHVDVTAQIDQAHFFGKAQKRGFLKCDSEMKKDYRWNHSLYPACN